VKDLCSPITLSHQKLPLTGMYLEREIFIRLPSLRRYAQNGRTRPVKHSTDFRWTFRCSSLIDSLFFRLQVSYNGGGGGVGIFRAIENT